MEKRKSIQDIIITNKNETKSISDIISEKTSTKRKKSSLENTVNQTLTDIKDENIDNKVEQNYINNNIIYENNTRKILLSRFIKAKKIIAQIKPIYLILFSLMILIILITIIVQVKPKNTIMDQSKKEADIVKKSLSRHIRLPEEEQIDIRKITNKVEDPFFKDANIGDYLIIFYKNRIAYIYSIDKDIIINAGVVFIDPKTATTTSSTNKKI